MTPEVKQRIEQIQQGIVPKGYKKTKTDIVPADWKESPIGEYIREYTEKTTIPNQYPVLTSARTGLMLQTDYYSNRQVTTEDNVGYNVLPYGYITFRSRSDDGRFRFNENRIIERGIISYFYPVFSFSEEVCHEYVLYLLNFSIYRRMYPYAEGTAQQVLSLKKLGQLKYSLPLVAEQKKIAEILSTQDKAIELQGRKIEKLKRFKKGCLERMFPRKGQKVPEKRFPGFTDDWEQRKLVSLCEKFTDGDWIEAKDQSHSGVRLIQTGNVGSGEYIDKPSNKKWISEETFGRLNCEEVFAGDILISRLPEPAGRACIVPNLGTKMITAVDCTIVRTATKTNSKYLLQFLSSQSYFDEVNTCLVGGTRQRISRSNLAAFDVPMPEKYEEQKAIGEFLCGIDNLITLHQRKLEEMKKQKKALMQLLLTGIVKTKGEVR